MHWCRRCRRQGGVGATAEKEAVGEDVISADDLARIVDAECLGAIGGRGIVEGGAGVDRHIVAVLVACGSLQRTTSLFRGGQVIRADLRRYAIRVNMLIFGRNAFLEGAPHSP